MKLLGSLLTVAFLLATGQQARSQTVKWGSPALSDLVNSSEQTLDSGYAFDLGSFEPGFTPTAANVTEWAANWHPFDRTNCNSDFGAFTSSAYMASGGQSGNPLDSLGLNSGGKDAFLRDSNRSTAQPGTEWLLDRAAAWTFPTYTGSTSSLTEWSASDLTSTDVPGYGKQGDAAGAGNATNLASITLQTHSLVPEPATAMLVALTGAFLALRRRRHL